MNWQQKQSEQEEGGGGRRIAGVTAAAALVGDTFPLVAEEVEEVSMTPTEDNDAKSDTMGAVEEDLGSGAGTADCLIILQ